jgi:hypothetical protein
VAREDASGAPATTAHANGRPLARMGHSTPRRVRVRVLRQDRSPERLERLKERLAADPRVDSVEVDPRTGSVLVQGSSNENLRAALARVVELVEEAGPDGVPGAGASLAVQLVKGLEGRIQTASGGHLSLRWVVPGAFAAAGIRQLLRQGLSAEALPWYVLFYYASDSFLKLYPEYAPKAPPEPVARS